MKTVDFISPRIVAPPLDQAPTRRFGLRALALWLTGAIAGIVSFSLVLVLLGSFFPIIATPLMFIRAEETLLEGNLPRVSKDWVSLEQISPRLIDAVIAAEDMKFYEHEGFDWEAIAKARKANERGRAKKTYRMRGASTISQQAAKNVFLWPARSWLRKGLEAYFTVLIEFVWSKRRILEVYLNVVELGDGVYGAEAAAQKYFHKSAKNLTSSEAALMASVLPNPRRFSIAKPSPYVRYRRTLIQRRMGAAALAGSLAAPLSTPASR